ncbi:carboxylesterase/lipase family protein [Yinghuangia seranimata]|uniref:carboxylesterase/lipase family protein n=1 Tax=Yinghuangia seranimata TaxID=408067 RepID=UPI00248BFA88|nr:carboxylesterase family protein [Yinghuangia seranimata]MDI2127576.1 carboxylesterase family protein [Yinghuangia seranimata]
MGVVVKTTGGQVAGTEADGLRVFKGIPFAAPPEGALRFRAPAPAEPWDGVRPAREFGVAPPQIPLVPGMPVVWRPSDGMDCLTVNVWTPGGEGDRLPVMVWIYGGGWKSGHAADPTHDGEVLARDGVVMVTFNYRVGFEGFGYVPGAPANRGFLDQAAALRWVQENIAAFGGDPDNVTVFGESGGGASVAALMTAPGARGLFRRAIVQSMAGRFIPEEEAARISDLIRDAAGIAPDSLPGTAPARLLAFQDVPLASMEAEPGAWSTPEAITAFSPTIDGITVVDKPWLAVRSGAARDIDLISGYTRDEFTLWAMQHGAIRPSLRGMLGSLPMLLTMARSRSKPDPSVPKQPRPSKRSTRPEDTARVLGLDASAAAAYRAAAPGASDGRIHTDMYSDSLFRMPSTWLAEAHAAAGGRAFLYEFAWRSPVFGGAMGAVHTIDIPAAFGHARGEMGRFLFAGKQPPADYLRLSEQLRAAWTGFAATGDPGWPEFTPDEALTRVWDSESTVVSDPLATSRRVWRAAAER